MRSTCRNRGFTLVELMGVIAIMGIVATIPVMHASPNKDDMLRKSAMRLVSDIRYIQRKTLYEKDSGYRIYANYGANPYQYQLFEPGKDVKIIFLDNGVVFMSTIHNNYASFNVMGRPVQPGSFILKNKNGKKIEITIEFSTGRVRMYEI